MTEDVHDGGSSAFVRADRIDLKSLDEQLQRHLNRALTLEKNHQENGVMQKKDGLTETPVRHGWEIDAAKLVIKSVVARGTHGTVHRGVYDGQDVAEDWIAMWSVANVATRH